MSLVRVLKTLNIPKTRADSFELRVDLLKIDDFEKIKAFRKKVNLPLILKDTDETRLEKLLELEFDYVDLAYDASEKLAHKIRNKYPKTKIITSFHDFEKMPDLDALFSKMQKPYLTVYKIAVTAKTSTDLLKAMRFLKEKGKEFPLSVIVMGPLGDASRLMGKILGNVFDYTGHLGLTEEELFETYHYDQLNEKTDIFALIGDPVNKSPSHHFHNVYFQKHKRNALYLKLVVKKEELSLFYREMRHLPFRGLSITMPLKQVMMKYADHLTEDAKEIGAINTFLMEQGKTYGDNTDGKGAMNQIEALEPLKGKRLAILGAGGSARAIAFEAKKRGMEVTILNRSLEKAKGLAEDLQVKFLPLKDFSKNSYDVLINTTPVKDQLLIDPSKISHQMVIMDLDHLPTTELLQAARQNKARVLTGYDMFKSQALLQQDIFY